MDEKDYINVDIDDALIERPRTFRCGSTRYNIYPSTLGSMKVCYSLISALEIDEKVYEFNPLLELLRLAHEKTDEMCEIIAIRTLRGYDDIFNSLIISKRVNTLKKALNEEQIAQLMSYILTEIQCNTEAYEKHLGIDKDAQEKQQIAKVKEGGNSVTVGGSSVWGSLIAKLAKNYGWTMDYILWGISFVNIKMLLADEIVDVYLTDEERKKVRIRSRKAYNGDDPEQMKRFIMENNGR